MRIYILHQRKLIFKYIVIVLAIYSFPIVATNELTDKDIVNIISKVRGKLLVYLLPNLDKTVSESPSIGSDFKQIIEKTTRDECKNIGVTDTELTNLIVSSVDELVAGWLRDLGT